MRARLIATATVAAIAAAGVPVAHVFGIDRLASAPVAPAGAASGPKPSATPGQPTPPESSGSAGRARGRRVPAIGFFRSVCRYSHTASDDPILMPGMSGMAMEHDFFGNTTTNASSTATLLRAAGTTTCVNANDTAAYWVPALYQNGQKITPTRMLAYYRVGSGIPGKVQAMPFGLQMIAGNESATAPQARTVVTWGCGTAPGTGSPVIPPQATPPERCPAGSSVHLALHFPNCWDGVHLGGASQTNVAYGNAWTGCPPGYPVEIPALSLDLDYGISSGAGLTLSTAPGTVGSIDTAHADVIEAWNESFLVSLVHECLNANLRCGTITSNGTPRFNVPPAIGSGNGRGFMRHGNGAVGAGAGGASGGPGTGLAMVTAAPR